MYNPTIFVITSLARYFLPVASLSMPCSDPSLTSGRTGLNRQYQISEISQQQEIEFHRAADVGRACELSWDSILCLIGWLSPLF